MVLLHALGEDHTSWEPVIAELGRYSGSAPSTCAVMSAAGGREPIPSG
jgi:hypothetical protein